MESGRISLALALAFLGRVLELAAAGVERAANTPAHRVVAVDSPEGGPVGVLLLRALPRDSARAAIATAVAGDCKRCGEQADGERRGGDDDRSFHVDLLT